MSTRSRIAIENEDGTVTSIYCHFDGYPSGVGAVLLKHYTDPKKVKELIDLGDISHIEPKLKPEPGEKHSFEHPISGVTVAYSRDRGEDYGYLEHRDKEHFFSGDIEEYGYLFTKEGKWMFKAGYKNKSVSSIELTEEMVKEK